jgi:hypothetical protein
VFRSYCLSRRSLSSNVETNSSSVPVSLQEEEHPRLLLLQALHASLPLEGQVPQRWGGIGGVKSLARRENIFVRSGGVESRWRELVCASSFTSLVQLNRLIFVLCFELLFDTGRLVQPLTLITLEHLFECLRLLLRHLVRRMLGAWECSFTYLVAVLNDSMVDGRANLCELLTERRDMLQRTDACEEMSEKSERTFSW